jgi:nucleotide-binding universal stress UspA family protein
MKKVIIATDYSAEAENAANYAGSLAAAQGHELVLFNLSPVSIHALNARASSTVIDWLQELANEKISKTAAALSHKYKVKVTPHLAMENFNKSLLECIKKYNAESIIMGMADKTVEQELLGNTTTATIHKFDLPVLAVPLTSQYDGIRKILFACNLDKGVHNRVLKNVRELAASFGATVEIFYVKENATVKQEAEQDEHAAIEENFIGINYYYKNVESNKVLDSIQQEIIETDADLLVMAPYKYEFWGSMVHRSKTTFMASGNSIPLLSLPA